MEERIRALAQDAGMTEKEALAYRCPSKTAEYSHDLPDLTTAERSVFNHQYFAMLGLLTTRVATRDHLEGYNRDC